MRSNAGDGEGSSREKLTGSGESPLTKSYYPELQRKLADLELFRALLDQSDDAIFLIDVDSGRFVDVIGPVRQRLGYDRDDLLRMAVQNILSDGDVLLVDSLFAGQAPRLDTRVTLISRDGRKVPCEIAFNIVKLRDRAFAVATARVTGDRKPVVDEPKRSGEPYRAIFDEADDGIIVLDAETGLTLEANEAFCRMYGCARGEAASFDFPVTLVGQGGSREAMLQAIKGNADEGRGPYEALARDKSGREFWIEVSLRRANIQGHDAIVAIVRDATARKQAEGQVKASLHEKEVLLKEIHHRVKNNLQVIASLLSIQSRYLSDSRDAELFQESQDRVKSMALVHEKLYQSEDLATIDFKAYINRLATHLFRSYGGAAGHVNLRVEVEDAYLDVDTAIPCGLIVNELLTNALKYAFPGGRKGTVHIGFRAEGDQYALEVSDDGVGIPGDIDLANTKSLGLQLVSGLIGQLEGSVSLDRSQGTKFTIRFKK